MPKTLLCMIRLSLIGLFSTPPYAAATLLQGIKKREPSIREKILRRNRR